MKGFKKFSSKSAIQSATSVAIAGAGSAGLDWLVAKYGGELPEWLTGTTLQATKVIGGAVLGSMATNSVVKSICEGVATVAAANLVNEYLPAANTEETKTQTPSGLPEGTIGRVRLGQRGFRRAGVRGVAGADFMQA